MRNQRPTFQEGPVSSDDGTKIKHLAAGDGPAVVIVHCSFAIANVWIKLPESLPAVAACLPSIVTVAARASVWLRMPREVEDIVAIIRHAGLHSHFRAATQRTPDAYLVERRLARR